MIWNKKFKYPTSTRALINGKRHYDVGTNEKLPSVTTILAATQSEEKKQKLAEWRARQGAQRADRIRDISAMRGTSMHTYLEGYITDQRHLDLTALGQEAGPGSSKVKNLNEWLDLYYDAPEEHFDSGPYQIELVAENIEEIIGFKPTVAYGM